MKLCRYVDHLYAAKPTDAAPPLPQYIRELPLKAIGGGPAELLQQIPSMGTQFEGIYDMLSDNMVGHIPSTNLTDDRVMFRRW